jgi:spermidine synthase
MPGAELRADLWIAEYITPWDIYQHGVTRILASARTEFQDMHIVETGSYGKALVLDGKWQSCTADEFLYHEPLVHPAMLCHGLPKKVLILGGGEGATAREVLRWKSVERALMVDIDGAVVEACREHLPEMHQNAFDDPRLEVAVDDAVKVLESTDETWDVIISDLSDPIEEGPSFKLFTKEYFEKVRRVLSPKGCFVVQAGPLSPPEMSLHVRLASTVRAVFSHIHSYWSFVPSYAAPWGFVLGSDRLIDTRPDPQAVDKQLRERITGGLRMLDGIALVGLFHTPAHIRRAIEQETTVYTLEAPPKFFGKGQLDT